MAYLTYRLFTTTSFRRASATEACTEILERFGQGERPISIRRTLLDANQFYLLSTTLGRNSSSYQAPKQGTPIPPGYHLVYFTPSFPERELGRDGTDRTVSPLSPYTRRMWAGGELEWSQDASNLLKVGQTVTETTRILSADPKKLRNGGEMIVVGVEKTFENEQGLALTDRRNWVFQKEIGYRSPLEVLPTPKEKELPEGTHQKDFNQSQVTLFRFSALTFNAHKIHYSPEWCREVEGHRTSVVHGPLNLINMLDFWRDTARNGDEGAVPRSIGYRALSPLYVGEQYRLLLEKRKNEGGEWKAEIWDLYGKLGMKGSISG